MADEEGGDEAAQAFEALRAEVTLMRRALERLTAERTELPEMPDYSETLGVIASAITSTAQHIGRLEKSPALSLTPGDLGRQIETAARTARAEDHQALVTSRQGFDDATGRLGDYMASHRHASAQTLRIWMAAVTGVIAGMVIWAIFAGVVARHVPASWQWPERMATRTLDMPMWAAGHDLMATADPAKWDAIVAGDTITAANKDALAVCVRSAIKAKKPVHCTVVVKVGGA